MQTQTPKSRASDAPTSAAETQTQGVTTMSDPIVSNYPVELRRLPESQRPTRLDTDHCAELSRAAYIVGCLAQDGLLKIDLTKFNWRQDWAFALEVVTRCLLETDDESGQLKERS